MAKELRDRVSAAVERRGWWLYLVVTFDPAHFDSTWSAYERAGVLWDKGLRRRIERRFGKVDYVQTWERHVAGRKMPHLNLILSGAGLRQAVDEAGVEWRFDPKAGHGAGRWCRFTHLRRWFAQAIPASGFGRRVWVEVLDEPSGIAAYLAKAAQDLSGARWKAGDQTPIGAPPHFRRLRSSKGLLPPVEDDEHTTGILVRTDEVEIPMIPSATGEALVDPAWIADIQLEQAKARAIAKGKKKEPRFETGIGADTFTLDDMPMNEYPKA